MNKTSYRIKNWEQYNRGLINRGSHTLRFSEKKESGWYAKANSNRMPGRPPFYSCIEVALTTAQPVRFPLRATQGFEKHWFTCLSSS